MASLHYFNWGFSNYNVCYGNYRLNKHTNVLGKPTIHRLNDMEVEGETLKTFHHGTVNVWQVEEVKKGMYV